MTSILFLADTQIGVGTVTLADQRVVLDQIIEVAVDEKVELVVHGGDVFEGPLVTPEHLRLFLDATEPLRRAGIPILLLRGNGRHDMAVRSVHALDVLREIPGFTVAERPYVVFPGRFAVCALPWVHPGRLLAQMNGSIDHARVNSAITEILTQVARELFEQARDELTREIPVVLVAHWAISGAKLPGEMLSDELGEPVLPWAELDAIGYDLIVGAHIHEPQMLSNPDVDQGPGFVIGSPQQLNFGEQGDHGCWLVDFDDSGVNTTFTPLASRQFLTLTFEHDDPLAQLSVSEHVGWDLPSGAIVRVRMALSEEQFHALDQGAVRRGLLEAGAQQVRFDLDVRRETRRRIAITEQLPPAEAMMFYCEATGIYEPLRSELIKTIKDWSSE